MELGQDRTPAWFLLQAIALVNVKIPRGEVVQVSAGSRSDESVLVWQFHVHAHDIGFRVLVDNVICSQFQERHQSSDELVDGILEDVPREAQVVLQWDNSYSRLRGKEVSYRMLWVSPAALHAAREATNEYNIKYNNDLFRLRSNSTIDRPIPAPSPKHHDLSHDVLLESLEKAIVEAVSTFMAQPNKPLQTGDARALIVAIEAILRSGVQVQSTDTYDVWPEESYFGFLVQAQHVLRDDAQVVADSQLFTPPTYMRYLGWGRARAFLFYALNRNILHRALDNLIKRSSIIDTYYDRTQAFLGLYDRAKKAVALLSALHGVKFALVPLQDNFETTFANFPPTLYQASPFLAFPSSCSEFTPPGTGDMLQYQASESLDTFNSICECTPVRLLLVLTPCYDIKIKRNNTHRIVLEEADPSKCIIVLQIRVTGNADIKIVLQQNSTTLAAPIKLGVSNKWTEITLRFPSIHPEGLSLLLDNRESLVWSTHLSYRVSFVTRQEYISAWRSTLDMADAICWKQVIHRDLDKSESAEYIDEDKIALPESQTQSSGDDASLSYSDMLMLPWLGTRSDSSCGQCMEQFSLFRRPQECSMCRKQCCVQCTRHTVPIRDKSEYVCDRCYLKALDKELAARQEKSNGEKDNSALEALRKNPSMDKYFKMLAFGVPASAIGQKMQQDYIDADLIHVFITALDPTTATSSSQGSKDKPTAARSLQRKKSTLRKLHWTTLDGGKVNIQASIWHRQTNKRLKAPVALSSSDMERLIELFGDTKSAKELKKNAKKGFSALDARRSNNINIALSRFKSFGGVDAIISALRACDLSKLTLDILQTLDEIAPTPAETKRYTNFRGKVTDSAEAFLIEMTKQPRVAEKIKSLIYVVTYPSAVAQLRQQIECITIASRDVLRSERLPRCFEIILALGNVLNEGTEQADASGVTIASLLKLSETRTIDQSMTLLQFLMQLIHNRGELDLFEIIDEFAAVETARIYSNVICLSQYAQIQKGLTNLKYEIKEEMLQQSVATQKAQAQAQRQANSFLLRQNSEIQPRDTQESLPAIKRKGSVFLSTPENPNAARQALLLAIQNKAAKQSSEPPSAPSVPARQALLSQIQQSAEKRNAQSTESSAVPANPRAALFAAIRSRKTDSPSNDTNANSDESKKATNAEESKPSSKDSNSQPNTIQEPVARPNPHAALLSEILNKKANSSQPVGRNALLEAIRQPNKRVNAAPAPIPVQSFPFITVMEQHAAKIYDDLMQLKDDVEVMSEVWKQVAMYLGESPTVASDYVFNLLHRFVMDFKVAYNLLVAKGQLSYYNRSGFLVHVGDSIATSFGPAVVLAVRQGGSKIEVKYPWAHSAFLNPSCVIHNGDIIMCRLFGIGIVTETRYSSGLLRIRFPFGNGLIRVDDILYRIPTSLTSLALHIRHGDPIHTPFGYAEVLSLTPIDSTKCTHQIMYQDKVIKAIVHAWNPKYGHFYLQSQYLTFAWA